MPARRLRDALALTATLGVVLAFATDLHAGKLNLPPYGVGATIPVCYNQTNGNWRVVTPWGVAGASIPNCHPPAPWDAVNVPSTGWDPTPCNAGGSFDCKPHHFYTEIQGAGAGPAPSTSTTTTTATTTTTTAPTCANGGIACGNPCGGGACNGVCVGPSTSSCTELHCGSSAPVCVALNIGSTPCLSDAACSAGAVCVSNSASNCGVTSQSFCDTTCPE